MKTIFGVHLLGRGDEARMSDIVGDIFSAWIIKLIYNKTEMDSNLTIYGYNNDNRWLVVGQEKKFLCRSLMCSILKDYTAKHICMP